jgi:hypothetical protein
MLLFAMEGLKSVWMGCAQSKEEQMSTPPPVQLLNPAPGEVLVVPQRQFEF